MKSKLKLYIFLISFTILLIFGTYKIYSIKKEYQESKNLYNSLNEYVNINNITIESNEFSYPEINFNELLKINNDIVGWITIENLNISYPIVKGEDNDYYLNHTVDNNYNSSGSIYLDYRNNANFSDNNNIIYGHNMNDGSMFSKITKYNNQDIYDKNPYYFLVTKEKKYKVEIISGYITDITDNSWMISFTNDNEFQTWIDETINKSLFKSNNKVTTNDKIITLSTCSNGSNDSRFLLVGVLKEI